MIRSKIYLQINTLLLFNFFIINYAVADTNKIVAVEYRLILFKEALSQFEKDVGRYPTTTEGLKSLIKKPDNIDNWNGSYVNNNFLPNDSWNNPFIYKGIENADGVKFIIYSFGQNKINEYGFGDDIVIDGLESEKYKTNYFIIIIGVLCVFFWLYEKIWGQKKF